VLPTTQRREQEKQLMADSRGERDAKGMYQDEQLPDGTRSTSSGEEGMYTDEQLPDGSRSTATDKRGTYTDEELSDGSFTREDQTEPDMGSYTESETREGERERKAEHD
jgi:hypothetical protein